MNFKSFLSRRIVVCILFVILAFFVYLFFTDFALVNRLIGSDEPEVSMPGKGDASHLFMSNGFRVNVALDGLDDPRVIVFGPNGEMLVSETKAGRVSKFIDQDKDGIFESRSILIEGLKLPHGFDLFTDIDGTIYIYIAETHQVTRYVYDTNNQRIDSATAKNIAKFQDGGLNFTRTIAFGPNFRTTPILPGKRGKDTLVDNKLYMSIGSSCDVCEESTWKRAAIMESDPEGTYMAEFAGGLRNSVFFAFHPVTKEIWATEIGRENLGKNLPPDEINIIKAATSEHKYGARRYGWPFCYGNKVKDETFKPEKFERIDIPTDCSQTDGPVIEIPAHSSPLGLAFIDNTNWPQEWQGDLLVTLHGSWNDGKLVGYKIVRYDLDARGNVLSQEPEDFITGWLAPSSVEGINKGNTFGQPVDLKFGPDDSLYISDDIAGVVYRISRNL